MTAASDSWEGNSCEWWVSPCFLPLDSVLNSTEIPCKRGYYFMYHWKHNQGGAWCKDSGAGVSMKKKEIWGNMRGKKGGGGW